MNWRELREQWLQDPDFRREWESLAPAFEVYRALLEVRERRGWTQEELAQRLGVTQSYVAKLESGRENLTLGQLAKVGKALGCRLRIEFVEEETDAASTGPASEGTPGDFVGATLTFQAEREGF